MAAIFSEDDRDFFNKFTTARKADSLSADILSDVHNVLSNKEFSHATRLAAAKLLVQTGSTSKGVHTHHPSVDFVILTAMLEAADEERMAEIVKAWMVYFDKKRVSDSEDEAMFLACLARILSKRGSALEDSFSVDELKRLHRYLLLTFVILSELERGSKFFETAVNFAAKTMSPDEKLFDFYLNEIDGHIRGKYGVLRILLKEGPPSSHAEKEAFVKTICDQLENKLDSQLIANAAADLVATMVVLFPTSARLQNLLVQNMVHHVKCIRTNTLRWLGRFEATKESGKFLRCLQHTLRESFSGVKDDIWPPRLWETEEFDPSNTLRVPTTQDKKMASRFASILRDAHCGSVEVEDEEGISGNQKRRILHDEENTSQQLLSFRFGEMQMSKEKAARQCSSFLADASAFCIASHFSKIPAPSSPIRRWQAILLDKKDVSCIDPRWDSEEAEDVLWEADRVLDAYLNVSTILHQRFRSETDSSDPLLHAGLKWHLPEIRLLAFQLWTSGLGKGIQEPENNRILEEFILSNGSTSMTSLRKAVEVASNSCSFSPEDKLKWETILTNVREREKLDEEQRGMSFLPDGLSISEVLQLPPAEKARERLEELLQLSGSRDSKSCPAFPDLYENLAKAGYDQRVFARFIIDLINLIKSNVEVKTALDVISETVTRCRLKVVVDYGCSVVDELLSMQHSDEHFFFLVEYRYCWAMNRLIDKSTECRTLPLSRILWSVCDNSRDLLKICFESCRATLEDPALDPKVHQRVLKTLKLFASKADCKMPVDFVEFLFWHCVDAQEYSDFLVRSAATILFGFVVRYITKSRVVPAFYMVSTKAKFWNEVLRRCLPLAALSTRQRILLLNFLSRLTLGNIECYTAAVQREIHSLVQSLIELLKLTVDIRQRRSCMEILVAMSPAAAHSEILRSLDEMPPQWNSICQADCDFLRLAVNTFDNKYEVPDSNEVVPLDLMQSKFVRLIEECRSSSPQEALVATEKMLSSAESHSAELTLQAVAMALTQIAAKLRAMTHVESAVRSALVAQCSKVLEHKWCPSRAASIASRVPTALGLTKSYYQKCYVLQVLRQWERQEVD